MIGPTSTFDPVPSTLESVLDPWWLSRALDDVPDGGEVVEVEPLDSSRTIASKIRIGVVVKRTDGVRESRAYCVKGHFADPNGADPLATETRFYRDMRPRVGIRTPRPHYTGVDEAAGRSLIIMDDVVSEGGWFLDARSRHSIETIRDTLGQLARLHAATWGAGKWDEFDWLTWGVRQSRKEYPVDVLQAQLGDGRGSGLSPALLDAECVREAMSRVAEVTSTCVVHGDAHSGNIYLDSAGRGCWLDWQVVHIGHWATDVSYHIATSLEIDDRRTYERELLQHYLDQLAALGIDRPDWEEAWEHYTLHFPYGYFLWGITRMASRAVVLIHIPRLAAAITDHQTFRRLGVA